MEEDQLASSPGSKIKEFFSNLKNNKKNAISLGVLVLLLVGIPIGVYLVQQTQIFKPKASTGVVAVTGPETSFTLSAPATVEPGKEIRVALWVRSDIEAANLFVSKLIFPADTLEVSSINVVTAAPTPTTPGVPTEGKICAQVITRACQNSKPSNCQDFPTPCDVPADWTISSRPSTEGICAQVITRACDLRSTECRDFPTPCDVPTGWTISPPPTVASKTFFIENWIEKTFDNNAGTISLSGGVPNPGYKTTLGQPSGLMAEIVFKTKKAGSVVIIYNPESAIYRNSDNVNILGPKRLVSFKIENPATPTPTIGISCDINGDGLRDSRDGAIITACWNKAMTTDCAKFDVDNDGRITTTDIQRFSYACPQIFVTPTPTTPPTGTPTPTPQAMRRVFVTSTAYNGNLGGLAGADAKCQTQADSARLGGSWKAWLSDSITSAASRLEHATVPYKLLNGTTVANQWTDLTDGNLQNPITITEQKAFMLGLNVWTYTDSGGNSLSSQNNYNCHNWTTSGTALENDLGIIGQNGHADVGWTISIINPPCSTPITSASAVHLYCFEQGSALTTQATAGLSGDTNGDGKISIVDMSVLLSRFNQKDAAAGKADIDANGVVNARDFALLSQILIQNGVIKK